MTKQTPLYPRHVELGARLTEFAGYDMPLVYEGNRAEHLAVRENAGLFDVSHMGEIWVEGPTATADLMRLFTQDVSQLQNGQAAYGMLCSESGGIIDDLIVYRFSEDRYLICTNAANHEKDFEWIESHTQSEVRDERDEWAQLAIQGPKAIEIAAGIFGESVKAIKRFHFKELDDSIIARTGYTGEDGFELFCPADQALSLWDSFSKQAKPCGLSARDTLRLEAGLCLWGNDLNEETTPLEANLAWCVKPNRGIKFIGQNALLEQKERGVPRKLVGLMMQNQLIARQGYEICLGNGEIVGKITSGTKTPCLSQPIAMGYIQRPHCSDGEAVYVKIRNKLEPAKVCGLPFYRRS